MAAILVCVGDVPVALAGPRATQLFEAVLGGLAADMDARLALYKVAYAERIARGELPGPYRDGDAELFARAALQEDR